MPTFVHHKLDVYEVELYLVTDGRQWSALRRRLSFLDGRPQSSGMASFAVFNPKDGGPVTPHLVVWIDPKQNPTPGLAVNTIAHEASHAAGQILDWVGHQVVGTDEPHAYLCGWLTQWIYEHCPWLAS